MDTATDLLPGTQVEIRNTLDGSWVGGFEIFDTYQGAYRVRRLSDGTVIPCEFSAVVLRPER
jgi:hypothetical protein